MNTEVMKRCTKAIGTTALILALTAGCTTVKPWERGTLADPIMQANRDPLGKGLLEHAYFSREAASGGQSIGEAGCGCN